MHTHYTTPQATTRAETVVVSDLDTPCLLLDASRMNGNIRRLHSRLAEKAVAFRPHLKTAKSIEIARRMVTGAHGPATVSTLNEAEAFASAGITDITYAVGISPQKIFRVQALLRQGVNLTVLLDSVEQAEAVAAASQQDVTIPALIELDCDGHRSGVHCDDREQLLAIAHTLNATGNLRGVLTHAGESYTATSRNALVAAAENERASAVSAAEILRQAGYGCPVVSIGSTPTALFAENYDGITEVRAGVFAFFDLVQAGLGVCTPQDIAVSVMATVIGHQREKGWTIIDAGWSALSSDRGTETQRVDQGYGLVCDLEGNIMNGLFVANANQEHGIIARRADSQASIPHLPYGTKVRILPIHACATVEQHAAYNVIGADKQKIAAKWTRLKGW